MVNSAQNVNLDTTIAALQQGLTSISASDALALIDSWQQQLQGNDIAEDLGELKQALQSGNTSEMAKILSDLGEDTVESASGASADATSKLQQLGSLLSQAGSSLA